jgi:sulfite reductase (ferredoxin)
VRACPGTTHCVLAVTDSQGISRDIGDAFRAAPIEDDAVSRMRVHVSGCPNSCAQHQAADIGLAGCRVKIDGVLQEGYQVFIGGRLGRRVRMADRIGRVAATSVVDLVSALVEVYVTEREGPEELPDVVERLQPNAIAARLADRLPATFQPSVGEELEVSV